MCHVQIPPAEWAKFGAVCEKYPVLWRRTFQGKYKTDSCKVAHQHIAEEMGMSGRHAHTN